jgi:hypothetical protein
VIDVTLIPSQEKVQQFLRKGELFKYLPTGRSSSSRHNNGADPLPESLPNKVERRESSGPLQVFYSRQTRRITLERFLCSKIAWEPEKISFQEILMLFDNLLWCQDRSERDPSFSKTFGKDLESLTKILKNFRFSNRPKFSTIKKLSLQLQELKGDFLFPQRNLLNIAKHFQGKIVVGPGKIQGTDRRYLPPPKFVGKGYRDKGTLRNVAHDGSPSWQELATSLPLKTLEELLNE